MTTGERIRAARKAANNGAGITQRMLGELSGIAEPTIRRYELGKLNPKQETLQKIAKALNISELELRPTINSFERVEKILKDRNITHGQLAAEIKISLDQLEFQIKQGRISTDTFAKIGKYLNISPEYLNGLPVGATISNSLEKNAKKEIADANRKHLHEEIDELNDEGVKKASEFVDVLYCNPKYIRKDSDKK